LVFSLVVWLGLLTALLGVASLAKLPRRLGIRSRRAGGLLLGSGLVVASAAALWPAREKRSEGSLLIDRFMPVYHFREHHEIHVRAAPAIVFRAIHEVTPAEFRSLGILMGIRSLPARLLRKAPRRGRPNRPMLDISSGSSFLYLADEPPREVVQGTAGRFWKAYGTSVRVATPEEFLSLSDPSVARAVINFAVSDDGGGWSRVTTETRIATASPATRRKFAAYWRLIYPGSSLIRDDWLRAIKRRAEAVKP
jgi:hypothetical protein